LTKSPSNEASWVRSTPVTTAPAAPAATPASQPAETTKSAATQTDPKEETDKTGVF
jgi:ribosomal protein L12E/L44/L45/RPP1/RPP2